MKSPLILSSSVRLSRREPRKTIGLWRPCGTKVYSAMKEILTSIWNQSDDANDGTQYRPLPLPGGSCC